ncbi:MAG: HU family DNA-binding protein [Gammaproteobacteria bacterium]|nr:HU family DNA-binding protein [Gammaproteobacteria bacterium]MDH5799672.1 HU family DNA-binding protein [Gammaproteobacteria bacterium]
MAAKKKAAKKKAAAAAAPAKKLKTVKDPFTKSQLIASLSEQTDLTKKQVGSVLASLAETIEAHIKRNGAGVFTMPGLLKLKVVRKPATKARKGINPFTGEETVFKAKPARNVVKILPLKAVKEMAK